MDQLLHEQDQRPPGSLAACSLAQSIAWACFLSTLATVLMSAATASTVLVSGPRGCGPETWGKIGKGSPNPISFPLGQKPADGGEGANAAPMCFPSLLSLSFYVVHGLGFGATTDQDGDGDGDARYMGVIQLVSMWETLLCHSPQGGRGLNEAMLHTFTFLFVGSPFVYPYQTCYCGQGGGGIRASSNTL